MEYTYGHDHLAMFTFDIIIIFFPLIITLLYLLYLLTCHMCHVLSTATAKKIFVTIIEPCPVIADTVRSSPPEPAA